MRSVNGSLCASEGIEIEREAGSFSISADDMLVEVDSATGLRQVNAGSGTLAAYRFSDRPFVLVAKLRRIEPVVKVARPPKCTYDRESTDMDSVATMLRRP